MMWIDTKGKREKRKKQFMITVITSHEDMEVPKERRKPTT